MPPREYPALLTGYLPRIEPNGIAIRSSTHEPTAVNPLRTLGYLSLAVYCLSIVACLLLTHALADGPLPPHALPAAHHSRTSLPAARNPRCGFALNVHYMDDPHRYLRAIDDIADLGFDSVEILTPAFQENGASEKIKFVVGPGRGPSREMLLNVLRHTKQRGLGITLMPVVLLAKPRGNEWRGKIQPNDWRN